MGRKPGTEGAPNLQQVLDALDDPACREIVECLEDPMTASELSERCEIPQSTTYRKLDLLSDASLVEERVEVRTDGHHTTRYVLAFNEVRLSLDENRALDVEIDRPARTPEQRLSEMWSEVRKET
ncbi:winged helix-turn-helix domain-containing protein [Halomarina rubra]|uniref:Helix-turn-helix domain-containing protein n=1 Tax=Halomarina rubra TaxID=2071873 RepID=A0ABD6AY58_9EURY|nr:helix-turn-helix domain-containing protein [Halomarina rubra]